MQSYYHCSGCGLVIGRDHKPVKEYPRNYMVYAVMYMCEVCRSKGINFDTPIKQNIPKEWGGSESEQVVEREKECENGNNEILDILSNDVNKDKVLEFRDGKGLAYTTLSDNIIETMKISDKECE